MKILMLVLLFLPIISTAQFQVEELNYTETYYYEGMVDGSGENRLFSLSSKKNKEVARRINEYIYLDLFGVSLDSVSSFAALFAAEDGHGRKRVFNFEILENSKRFFTVYVSYKRPSKPDRSRRYYTFLSTTGEFKEMANLIWDDKYDEMAHLVYAVYAKELDQYIAEIDTINEANLKRWNVLSECASNYFTRTYRLEYGFMYLTDAGVHFVNPFCPDRDGIKINRREWFSTIFTYEEVENLMPVQMIPYVKTGKWN